VRSFRPFGRLAKQMGIRREGRRHINIVANARTLEFLASTDARTIAEVGVDQGATSLISRTASPAWRSACAPSN
jgi:hypothetical protein